MSQPASARALPRPAASRPRRSSDLHVVAAPAAGHGGLMLVCLLMLLASFVGVLLLNISMAKGSFVINDLQHESSVLTDSEAALHHALDAQSAPAELAKQAIKLGMVPAGNAAFIRLSDGKVLGVAEPADGSSTFSVVAQGPRRPSASASAKPGTPTQPEPGTTVTHKGTVTTTTIVQIRGDQVETTVTSVDSATGRTTSTTTTAPLPPAPKATPTPSAKAAPKPKPTAAPAP